MGRVLVVGGIVLVLLGLVVLAGFPLFRLPGDFAVKRGPSHVLLSAGLVDPLEHIVPRS
jgi:hypothetical protein